MTVKKKAPSLSEFFADENQSSNEQKVDIAVKKTNISSKKPIIKSTKSVRLMTFNIPVKVKKQLEELWFAERESGQTQTDLILQGLDMLFRKKGLPSIKDIMQ